MHSIVIPTAGRADFIHHTLHSLVPQINSNTELLVVENGPQRGVEARVGKTRSHLNGAIASRIRYIHEPTPGLLAGRHRGLAAARGDLISYFDDDVVVQPETIAAARKAFVDPAVDLVGGPSRPAFLTIPPPWFAELAEFNDERGFMLTYMSLIDLRRDVVNGVDPNLVFGQNFHIRRDALIDLGGFHPDIVPDHLFMFQGDGETGLTMKFYDAGRHAVYLDAVAIRHIIPHRRMTIDYLDGRARYQGRCNAFARLRQGENPWTLRKGSRSSKARNRTLTDDLRQVRKGRLRKVLKRIEREEASRFACAYEVSEVVREWTHKKDYLDYQFPQNL